MSKFDRIEVKTGIEVSETLSDMFAQYFNVCYPEGCPKIQHAEIKQAFYAGTWSLLCFFLSDSMPDDEDEGAEKMEAMFQECRKELEP